MGVMGAIAVCLASALPLAKAAEEGPESLITAPIKALEENNPKLIWDMLPASYQKDLNGLVQAFAKEMDAELWDAGLGVGGRHRRAAPDEKGPRRRSNLPGMGLTDLDTLNIG